MSLLDTLTTALGTVKNVTAEHSPQIMFVGGIISIAAGFALTIKNGSRATELLEERKDAIERLKELQEEDPDLYSEEKLAEDIRKVNITTAVGLGKTYGPGLLLGALGCVSTGLGLHEYHSRLDLQIGYSGALLGLIGTMKVNADKIFGEGASDKIMYGLEDKKVTIEEEDPETGKVKRIKKDVQVATNPWGVSQYAVYFDQDTSTEWDRNDDVNEGYIMGVMAQANDRLQCSAFGRTHKTLLLNEVYEMLGVQQTEEGSKVGWDLRSENGDHMVIFKVIKVAREDYEGSDTYHECFLIDFNVDGPVTKFMTRYNFNKTRAIEAKA